MASSTKFDYSRGSAFVHEGYLYYSPNSKRNVIIPPPPAGHGPPPFTGRRFNAANFRQPVWWSEPWGWLSFVPLAPNFLSYPFEPLSFLPKIVPVEVSVNPKSSDPQHYETRFTLTYDEGHLWLRKEWELAEAAQLLRFKHGICGTPPPLPSTFGFHRNHRSRAIAQQMVSLAQSWFGVWMGYLAYIVRQTLVSPYRQPDPNSPDPYWYQLLLENQKFSLPWLDGLASSPVCKFGESVPRAGVVIPWMVADKSRPTIEFFLDCDVPLFFPWNSSTEKAIRQDLSLVYLRPPVELIQEALTFLTRSPNNTPLAALIIKRFCGLDTEILNPETARLLQFQYASSEVVEFVSKHFLTQYDSLAQYKDKSDADRALHQAMEAYHDQNIEKAHAAAMLPQQGMIERDGQQNLYGDWKDFFRKRAMQMPEIRKGASAKELEAFANRKRQPPRKRTHMFTWAQVETSGGLSLWSHKKVDQRNFEDVLEYEVPYVYDEVLNEWDVFPDFIWDEISPPEAGIPSVCLAPPLAGRAVPLAYGSDDDGYYGSDDGLSSRSAPPVPRDSNQSRSYQVAAHPPVNVQSSQRADYYDSDDGDISDKSFDMNAPSSSHRRSAPPAPLDSNQSRSDQSGHSPVNVQSSLQHTAASRPLNSEQSPPGQFAPRHLVNGQPSSYRRGDPPPHSSGSGQSAPPVNVSDGMSRHSNLSPIAPVSDAAALGNRHDEAPVEDDSSNTPLLQALQYNYGYTRGIHTLPSSTPRLNWDGVGRTLGYMRSLSSNDEDIAIRHFVSYLASQTVPPADMFDLHPRNFLSLSVLFDFGDIIRLREDVFVFVKLSFRSPSCDWVLAVRTPLAALYVVRYIFSNPTHTALTVAYRLAKYGVPFNTLHLRPTLSTSARPTSFAPRHRLPNYRFTSADFNSSVLACHARLQGPAGRAALLQGGIIGRIARQFVSVGAVLDGPSVNAIERYSGLVVDSESLGHQYRDDALSEEDIYVICGSYTVYTGHGEQVALLSYFPRPNEWDRKNGFAWLEWTNASEDLFHSILAKNRAGRKPLGVSAWRNELRGFGYTRHLLQTSHAQATLFVAEHCPVRS